MEMNPSPVMVMIISVPKIFFLYLYNLRDLAGMEIIATFPRFPGNGGSNGLPLLGMPATTFSKTAWVARIFDGNSDIFLLLISSLSFDTQS